MIFSRAQAADKAGLSSNTSQRRGIGGWGREPEAPARPAGMPAFAVSATDDIGDAALGFSGTDQAGRQARLALADSLSASQPVTHRERFAGRNDTLTSLIAAIEQQRAHVVLYGERGIGKTSLIHVFAETAREAQYLVLYGSCGVEARFDDMFRSYAAQIPLLYHNSISPTADEDEHRRTFADLLGSQPVDPRELAEVFAQIVGTRVVIVLDEYDRVADPAFRRNIAELIKNLSDRAARLQLILTGVASNLDELIGFTPSIRRNIVGLAVGPMADADMRDILARAEAATGLKFAPEATALITRMAGGSPYLVRLLGNRAAGRALDERRMLVSVDDAIAGTEAVLAEWNSGLPKRVQAQLSRAEVRAAWPVLIAAARASGTPDGWFAAHDVVAELPNMQHEAVAATLDGFVGAIDVFDRAEDAAGDAAGDMAVQGREPRYRFRTQGVAQLLGLSAALARAGR